VHPPVDFSLLAMKPEDGSLSMDELSSAIMSMWDDACWIPQAVAPNPCSFRWRQSSWAAIVGFIIGAVPPCIGFVSHFTCRRRMRRMV
jgi:hypothetical protein